MEIDKLAFDRFEKGRLNRLSDVEGVTVGHSTVDTARHKTGVTVIMPSSENPFVYKLPAAAHVVNGFGKTQGTIQIKELGTLETPIALTNTLNVGLVHDALVRYMAEGCKNESAGFFSVNPVVAECNDCTLNDIVHPAVDKSHVFEAIASASRDFALGDVGAGKGMVCHGLKGGVGSASRVLELGGRRFTLGVLALTNHGRMEDLTLGGEAVGRRLACVLKGNETDQGSCILIMATDLPLSSRQLGRVLRRAPVGLARLGSFMGNGSGEVAIGFSTANKCRWNRDEPFASFEVLNESLMDLPFEAMADACEEAVFRSMLCARTVSCLGTTVYSLRRGLELLEGR